MPSALLLGTAAGMRSVMPAAVLALRDAPGRRRTALLVGAAGELAADKLPVAPPRTDPPGLVGRVLSGADCGRRVTGARGALVGAAAAAASSYAFQAARARLADRVGPLPAALAEDALCVAVCAAALRR